MLHIREKQKITSHWLKFMFVVLGIQAVSYWIIYLKSQENYDLLIAIFLSLVVTTFVIIELFFRTYRNTIDLKEIKKVSIQKVLFEKENVLLKIKLKRKSRNIIIDEVQAEKIKNKLESAISGIVHDSVIT